MINDDRVSESITQIQLMMHEAEQHSDSAMAIVVPDRRDSKAMRQIAVSRYNLSLGQRSGLLAGKAFRIGHLDDLNGPMLLGVLATTEMALKASGIPHHTGGINAAVDALSD